MPASTTRRFCVPYTRKCESTTPPLSRGSIAHVPLGWNSVLMPLLMTWSMASSPASSGGTNCAACRSLIDGVAKISRLKRRASCRIWRSTGFESHRGSMTGGSNGSALLIVQVPLENGCITARVRLPALLFMISYAAVVLLASLWTNDCFCRVKPVTIEGSSPETRCSAGSCSFAALNILSLLLLINGKGGKARAFGEPAVHGPKPVSVRSRLSGSLSCHQPVLSVMY